VVFRWEDDCRIVVVIVVVIGQADPPRGRAIWGNPDDDDTSSDDAVSRLANWRRMLRMLSIKPKRGGEMMEENHSTMTTRMMSMSMGEWSGTSASSSNAAMRTMGQRLLVTAWDRRTRRKRT
jgi:hypothetical protein